MKDISRTLIEKVILKEEISKEDIYYELYSICDNVHSSCDSSCPVNRLNGGEAPDTHKDFETNRGCDCFKNGKAMYDFIKKHSK